MRRARRGNFIGFLLTVGLHVGILAAMGIAHSQPEPPLVVERDFVAAELVKLGKPREKFWLPRITKPPPPPPPKANKVTYDQDAQPVRKEEQPPPPKQPPSKAAMTAQQRARMMASEAYEPEEGLPTGSAVGTANEASGDPYVQSVIQVMLPNFNLPAGIAPEQIATSPVIKFRLSPEGVISEVKLARSSGNNFVDDACVQAAQLTRRLPAPPAKYRRGMQVACEKL
jgi:periplasmic protein TonB